MVVMVVVAYFSNFMAIGQGNSRRRRRRCCTTLRHLAISHGGFVRVVQLVVVRLWRLVGGGCMRMGHSFMIVIMMPAFQRTIYHKINVWMFFSWTCVPKGRSDGRISQFSTAVGTASIAVVAGSCRGGVRFF